MLFAILTESRASLSEGGFKFKFIVRSGETPSEEASPDGVHLKVLGYQWAPKEDYFSPGFSEINFNRKRRGTKKSNPFPVRNPKDLTKLMTGLRITRRMVLSKIAEFHDPLGF